MGFFDELGKSIGNDIKKKNERLREYQERARDMSDERLIREFKNSSGDMMKKLAYGQELKNRGYGNQD